MWNFKDNKDLVGVAFIDGETYIHHAIALKNFVVVADINRSIQVLRYKVQFMSFWLMMSHVTVTCSGASSEPLAGQQGPVSS